MILNIKDSVKKDNVRLRKVPAEREGKRGVGGRRGVNSLLFNHSTKGDGLLKSRPFGST